MLLPGPRGALSTWLCDVLERPPHEVSAAPASTGREDEALTLWTLHELHYRGFDGVDDGWEWHPALAGPRWGLERGFEARLRQAMPVRAATGDVVADLRAVIDADTGPSLARHVQRHGSRDQTEQLLRQRSLYHLKEADPTSWVIPRLDAGPKAALVEIQFDEYGDGDPARLHHRLFERGLAAAGIESAYGVHVDEALTEVLEQNNAVSMFGLHRRLRGAALGHFAVFEATSSVPSRQLAQGLRRLSFPDETAAYYDEHVEADAVHEQVAVRDVCGALVAAEPELLGDVLFGAWACLELESRTATALLTRWGAA